MGCSGDSLSELSGAAEFIARSGSRHSTVGRVRSAPSVFGLVAASNSTACQADGTTVSRELPRTGTDMKIGVISTMSGFVWGGSEELWAAMVREALRQGHQAAVSVYRFRAVAQQIKELERRGARVLTRPMPRDEGLKAKVNRLWNPPFR